MTGSALHLLLVAALTTPPKGADLSDCKADDLDCTSKASVAAAAATSGKDRARYLYIAHRAFLSLYDLRQDSRDLCQAQDLIRQARKVPGSRLGERLADSERETQSRLRSSGVECSRNKPSREKPPVVAVTTPTPETPQPGETEQSRETTLVPVPSATPGGARVGPPAKDVLVPPSSTPQLAARSDVEQGASVPAKAAARPARALLIGGGIALGASLVLGGLAIYFPVRAKISRRTCIEEMCDGFTGDQFETKYPPYKAGGDAYERDIEVGVVTGVAGGAVLVTAIVLLTMGARRKARGLAVGPMIRQAAGGVLFTGRF